MSKIQKLELTWFGKDENIEVEPRILIENKELSNVANDPNTENMLIHGDNLLALKALEQKYAGQIKCIYIDPPYNTGNAFEHYDDNLEHSIWLSLMKPRLEILYSLLNSDGVIFIQIDDNEQAYLKVLCDEIFGRKNFITSIAVKVSPPNGVKIAHATKTILKEKEFILVYAKNAEGLLLNPQYIEANEFDKHYNKFILGDLTDLSSCEILSLTDVLKEKGMKASLKDNNFKKWLIENKDRIFQPVRQDRIKNIDKYKVKKIIPIEEMPGYYSYNGSQVQFVSNSIKNIAGSETYARLVCDLWTDIAFNNLFQEGGVVFKNSKKPEKLIKRCFELTTNPGDIVLDSFLGSGTTSAVAHKMNRRWIGIEMGEHAYSLCKVRLDKVINGEQGGISKLQNWKGGGGYRFYELAPTLIKEDAFGQPIINPEYNAEMLAAAVAKHEGYFYNPDSSVFWKQSNNKGNSYLFVTTNHVDSRIVETIKADMKEDEFVLIVCKSFDSNCNGYKNIAIKKIPQSLLKNCEFGVDNYNLNIINPPVYEEDEDE